MSEAPEDPLDVVYAALNSAAGGPDDPPDSGVNSVDAGEAFLTALADLGIRRATAEALGWSWCEDSRALSGVRGAAGARPFAGIRGPRSGRPGAGAWFFIGVPPLEGGEVVTSSPRNLLSVLPGVDLEAADRLHLAGDPVTATALWQEGRPVAWFPGAGGWRGTDRRMLAELGALRAGSTVVLHPAATWQSDRAEETGWRELADELAAAGMTVRVATGDGDGPAGAVFARQRLAIAPDHDPGEMVTGSPGAASRPRALPFSAAIDRADERIASRGGSFFAGGGAVLAVQLTRTVVICLEHVARGPGGPWAYDGGVWRPAWARAEGDGGGIGMLVVRLLGDSYKPGHETTVLAVLARMPDLPGLTARLDTDGWDSVLNFRNGLLDLGGTALRPHDPAVLSTWQLPSATTPVRPAGGSAAFWPRCCPRTCSRRSTGSPPGRRTWGTSCFPATRFTSRSCSAARVVTARGCG